MKRSDIILLLLNPTASNEGVIVGTTRLQKLLFLLEKEGGVLPGAAKFDFVPYKFGPASKRLYDDLEFLTSLGLIVRSGQKSFEIEPGPGDIDAISAGDLLTDNDDSSAGTAPERTQGDSVVYRLTEKGLKYLNDNGLMQTPESQTADKIKRKYSRFSLTELLGYVYSKYPEYTIESEIRDRFNA